MFKKQGTSKRSASTSIGNREPGFHEATPTDMGEQASACDMAWAFEELEHCEELSEVQLATVVGGRRVWAGGGLYEGQIVVVIYDVNPLDLLPLEHWTNNLKKKEEKGEEILQ
jgi:hypothetical protein